MKRWRAWWAPALVLLACSGGGDGCTDCSSLPVAPYPNPPPPGGEVQPDAVRARLTQNALNFLAQHLDLFLDQLLVVSGDEATYYIDEALFPTGGPVSVTDSCLGEPDPAGPCSQPTYPSRIYFEVPDLLDSVSLEWLPNDAQGRPGLRFTLQNFQVFLDLAMYLDLAGFGEATCLVQDAGQLASLQIDALTFDMRLRYVAGPSGTPTLTAELDCPDGDAANCDFFDLDTSPLEGDFAQLQVSACTGGVCTDPRCIANPSSCTTICEDIITNIADLSGYIVSAFEPMLDSFGPALATVISDGVVSALAALPLQMELQVDLGGLLGGMFANTQPVHVKMAPSPNLAVTGEGIASGMFLGIDAGAASAAVASCAEGVEAPDLAALQGAPPAYSGFVEVVPEVGEPHIEAYHLVLATSESLLAQAAFGALQTGLACLDIDSYDIASFPAAGDEPIAVTAGYLLDPVIIGLAPAASPLFFRFRPTTAPQVRLGAGHEIAPGLFEPLVQVVLDDLNLEIYMWLDEAYQRIVLVRTDLTVELGIERTANQTLSLGLSKIDPGDPYTVYNEIAPTADFPQILQFAVELAAGNFLGENAEFQFDVSALLADALGVPVNLHINAVRRDVGPTGAKYLSVFGTLCDEEDEANPGNLACYVDPEAAGGRAVAARVDGVEPGSMYQPADPARYDLQRWMHAPAGGVTLRVSGGDLPVARYEYQWRVDGGAWSTFRAAPEGTLRIDSALLYPLGLHAVDVRARRRHAPHSAGEIARVHVRVDPERPLLETAYDGTSVWIDAFDLGSPDRVELWGRWWPEQGEPEAWRRVSSPVDTAGRSGALELMGRDEAGNTSPTTHIQLDPLPRRAALVTASSAPARAGCQGAPYPLWAAALAVATLWRRAKKRYPAR